MNSESLIEALRGIGLSDLMILDIVDGVPCTVKELAMIGVPDSITLEALDIIQSGKYEIFQNEVETLRASTLTNLKPYYVKKCALSSAALGFAILFLVVLKCYPVVIIINLIGIGIVMDVLQFKDNFAAKLLVLCNVTVAALCLVAFAGPWFTTVISRSDFGM
jgi:hypothetical protein